MRRLITAALVALTLDARPAAATPPPLEGVRRVVFLGDSITYAGQFAEDVEAVLRVSDPALRCEFLNVGLPSETVSGLSEPGHAGGQFPRPDLHERLDRVLAKTKPDLVVACYGMNDGIYHPFREDRFAKYRDGIKRLREKVTASGAKILHVTPSVFDPVPIKSQTLPAGLDEYRRPYEGYDDVLDRYSQWLTGQRAEGWDVVDVHGPMKRSLDAGRAKAPNFRLADDGVHVNAQGHWLIADAILRHWGVADGEKVLAADPHGAEVLALVQQKQRSLKDAWLTATGHRRPGMSPGRPLDQALGTAAELDAKIEKLLRRTP